MDPIALASMIVRVLVPIFERAKDRLLDHTYEDLSQAAEGAGEKIYDVVRRRLTRDPYDEGLLKGVEVEPADDSRRKVLQERLAALIEKDPDFARALKELVGDRQESPSVQVSAHGAGLTAGGPITLQAGGDVVGRDKNTRG